MNKLILVCGPKCSGKSVFGNIAYNLGFEVIEMGDIFRKYFFSPEDIINFRKKDPLFLAKKAYSLVSKELSIIIGVRTIDEYLYFKQKALTLLVYIKTKQDLLLKRMEKRKAIDKDMAKAEEVIGTKALYKKADIIIENNASIDEFKDRVTNFLKILG